MNGKLIGHPDAKIFIERKSVIRVICMLPAIPGPVKLLPYKQPQQSPYKYEDDDGETKESPVRFLAMCAVCVAKIAVCFTAIFKQADLRKI